MELRASLLVDCKAMFGAGLHWNPSRRRLFWTDRLGAALWSCTDAGDEVRRLPLSHNLSNFAAADDGRFLAGYEDGLGWLDPVTGDRSVFEPYVPDVAEARMADGTLDRQGRYVVGGDDGADDAGTPVWLVDRGAVKPVLERVAAANALAFSPDGTAMYFADTPTGVILRYRYDSLHGLPSEPEVYWEGGPADGLPHGATVDTAGALWSARFGAGRVDRILPNRTRDLQVEVPVSQVSDVAIGGRGGRRLFVATARLGLDAAALDAMPEAGGIFAVDIPVAGLPDGTYRR